MRALQYAAQHLWLGVGTSDSRGIASSQNLRASWHSSAECGHRLKPLPGRRLGLMLSMVCFYGAAAPHLRAKEASMRQLHSLILAKSSRALNQLTGMPATRCMTTSQLSGPAAAQQAAPATVRPHVRRSRRLLVPLTAAAASLAAGGGVALLIACDFDQVQAYAVVASVPRTGWAVSWALRSGLAYSRCMAAHPDHESEVYRAELALLNAACARRLLALCQANGGVYIKAAQLVTTAQAAPAEYRRTLEVLQDQVDPRPFAEVELAVQRELGAPIAQLFADFEPAARAAASLAQVHKARLADGREVAVKIQYAGLPTAVAADITTLSALASLALRWFPNAFDFGWVLEELQRNLSTELDFRVEARNAQRLATAMAQRRSVAVPRPVPELSGERVLTMEWIEGCKLTDVAAMRGMRIHPRDVAIDMLHAFAQMTFVDGFVHGDPHSGNILVRPHPGPQRVWYRWFGGGFGGWQEPQLVLLDHGLIVSMPDDLRQYYCQLWSSFMSFDEATARSVAFQIAGERGADLLPKLLRPGALKSAEQRRALRSQAGVSSIGDLGRLLEGLPRPLVDFLKVSAIIRGATTALGATVNDRLRINATYALKGMSISRLPDGRVRYEGSLAKRRKRLQIGASIFLLRMMFWIRSTVAALWTNVPGRLFAGGARPEPLLLEG